MKVEASKKRHSTEDTENVIWKRLEVFYENEQRRIPFLNSKGRQQLRLKVLRPAKQNAVCDSIPQDTL